MYCLHGIECVVVVLESCVGNVKKMFWISNIETGKEITLFNLFFFFFFFLLFFGVMDLHETKSHI